MMDVNVVVYSYSNIIAFEFENRTDMTTTFFRVMEMYESPHPKIRNKKFNLIDFVESYLNEDGTISYFKDWDGFNISDKTWKEFRKKFKKLSKKEKFIQEQIDDNISSDNFYLIAYIKNDLSTMIHEFSHAFYYLNEDYRKSCAKLIKKIKSNVLIDIKKQLIETGYPDKEEILNDEIAAYFTESDFFGHNQLNSIANKIIDVFNDKMAELETPLTLQMSSHIN